MLRYTAIKTKIANDETTSQIPISSTPAHIVPGKGQHYELCILDFNIDIESNTCSVTVDENGNTDLTKACTYCYAKYNYKKNTPYKKKIIKESVFRNLKNKIPEFSVLRIGKNVECGSSHTRSELIQVLEACVKYSIRPIVTSKILDFDKKVSDLVKESRGVVHISLGVDIMEPGAISLGYSNETRFKNAQKYLKSGCTTAVRVVDDITLPMSRFIKKVYLSGMPILVTPLHYPDKNSFSLRRKDITWDEAKEKNLFEFSFGSLRPLIIHDDWKKTKERCGIIGGKEYCNNCNLGKIYYSDEVGYSKKAYNEKMKLKWNT